MKYLINKMQCNVVSQQVGWLDGRMFKCQEIKPHKWCVRGQ
jgi:hypothetical protein